MEPAYVAAYEELHRRHWWWRARQRLVLKWLRRFEPRTGYGNILDVGCGEGLWFDELSRFGLPEGVESVPERPEGPAHRWRIWRQEFDERFDPGKRYGLILMLDVLEHLEDDRAALTHAVSLLAPEGVLVVTVPAFNLLWTQHDALNHHRRRYTLGALRRLARSAHLKVEHTAYIFKWMTMPKLAVRASELVRDAGPQVPRTPPLPINAALYGWCCLEQATWGKLPFFWGTSAMLIGARR